MWILLSKFYERMAILGLKRIQKLSTSKCIVHTLHGTHHIQTLGVHLNNTLKSIYTLVIVSVLSSCNSLSDSRTINVEEIAFSAKTDSATITVDKTSKASSEFDLLELPVVGSFDLSEMKIDSLNEYGAGDCWGTIRRYSIPNIGLAIDSMTCGEYGFSYTYYLLNDTDIIQMIFSKTSESVLNTETNEYCYIQKEQVIDFSSDPAISMTRTDTVTDYNRMEKAIDKDFIKEILKDRLTSYQHIEMEYQELWQMESDY